MNNESAAILAQNRLLKFALAIIPLSLLLASAGPPARDMEFRDVKARTVTVGDPRGRHVSLADHPDGTGLLFMNGNDLRAAFVINNDNIGLQIFDWDRSGSNVTIVGNKDSSAITISGANGKSRLLLTGTDKNCSLGLNGAMIVGDQKSHIVVTQQDGQVGAMLGCTPEPRLTLLHQNGNVAFDVSGGMLRFSDKQGKSVKEITP